MGLEAVLATLRLQATGIDAGGGPSVQGPPLPADNALSGPRGTSDVQAPRVRDRGRD